MKTVPVLPSLPRQAAYGSRFFFPRHSIPRRTGKIMKEETKNSFRNIIDIISQIDYISPEDLPNIDLYMDQVTTFMDKQLSSTRRHADDKILTKTMINNYAKSKLLPPPEKKRYSREHLLLMVFIYYFKNILSINDIQTLLEPLKEKYFQPAQGDRDMSYIYQEVFRLAREQSENFGQSLLRQVKISEGAFSDADAEDQEYLREFSFICLMIFDVYVKKYMIEHLIDGMSEKRNGPAEKRNAAAEKKEHKEIKERKESKESKERRESKEKKESKERKEKRPRA